MRNPETVAVVGSGISGLSAAWLLSKRCDVTLIESDDRLGGHANTVDVRDTEGIVPVDTGFIVYNTASYPNLIAMFDHLGVETASTDMSFAVSLDSGRYEYAGSSFATLVGQPANLVRPAHWRMLSDTMRFFRDAERDAESADSRTTLGAYVEEAGYSRAFIERHILPMAAAIWSTPSRSVLDFPFKSFVRFFSNHGLLQVKDRPQWRTVVGGSRRYVERLIADARMEVMKGAPAVRIERHPKGVSVTTSKGRRDFDACVIATHADDALRLLGDAAPDERALLGAFRYSRNNAVLHRDQTLMPHRRRLWSSWNYLASGDGLHRALSVTYWMNNLQPLPRRSGDLFVTLNPFQEIAADKIVATFDYTHPMYDAAALDAQRQLWRLQGARRTWFCGSYFGYGFHEDGLQSGLAAAEDLAGVRRPWRVADESGRIHLAPADPRGDFELRGAAE